MEFLKRIWESMIRFFSPTEQDWKDFRKSRKSGGDALGYGGDVFSDGDCGGGDD